MLNNSQYLKIHYNAFDSIEEQLAEQGYFCENIKIYETAKDDILFLYIHNFMCDSEKDKVINKLHKKLMYNIRKGVDRNV